MLEELGPSSYDKKYELDDAGDALMVTLANAEIARGGDRQMKEQITARGVLSGDEIQVVSLCFVPLVSNAAGDTVCHYAPTPAPTVADAIPTPSQAPTAAPTQAPSLVPLQDFVGYIVDNVCWNKPNHRGIDGSLLGSAPGTHILHCLTCCGCPADGYTMLEELGPSSYDKKYELDDAGDALMVTLANAEIARGGDRQLQEQITARGVLSGDEIQVVSLCFVPLVSNAAGDTVCHYAEGYSSVGALTTGSASLAGGDLVLGYAPTADGLKIQITASLTLATSTWLAVGFNGNGRSMTGTDAVITRATGSSSTLATPSLFAVGAGYSMGSISHKACSGITEATVSETSAGDSRTTSVSFIYDPASSCFSSGFGCSVVGGEVVCEESQLVWAYGSSSAWAKHTRVGSSAIRFGEAVGGVGGASEIKVRSGFVAHAVMMVLGWGVLLPSGVISARFFKKPAGGASKAVQGGSGFMQRPDCWFQMHRAVQVTGLLLALIGTVAIVATIGDAYGSEAHLWARQRDSDTHPSLFNDPHGHGVMGLVIMCLGVQQPLFAIFRPHPPKAGEQRTQLRWAWEWCHKGLGYLAILLAVCQIFGGFSVLASLYGCDGASSSETEQTCGEIKAGYIVYSLVLATLCTSFVYFSVVGLRKDGDYNEVNPKTRPPGEGVEAAADPAAPDSTVDTVDNPRRAV
jgi:hypothetical protein